jgi:hypothetical protein
MTDQLIAPVIPPAASAALPLACRMANDEIRLLQ